MNDPTWKAFPEDCPECSGDSEIFTIATKEGYGCDGDPVRCTKCGLTGYWSGDSESDFYVNWIGDVDE